MAAMTPNESISKPIIIAVIDTGIDSHVANLCKYGHKSFVDKSPLTDQIGHGTNMAKLIKKFAGNGEYCMVSIKWYKPNADGLDHTDNLTKAIQYAANLKVDFVNISANGTGWNRSE
jgi:subtilisin family serine protease